MANRALIDPRFSRTSASQTRFSRAKNCRVSYLLWFRRNNSQWCDFEPGHHSDFLHFTTHTESRSVCSCERLAVMPSQRCVPLGARNARGHQFLLV